MSVDVPSKKELLQFVGNITYGDFSSSSLQDYSHDSCSEQSGGAFHLSSVLPALSDAIGAPISTKVHENPAFLRESLGFPKVKSACFLMV